MTNRIIFSTLELPGKTTILKGHIPSDLCDELEEKARPFVEDVNCNLKNTERTGWRLFQHEELAPLFQKVADRVTETILSYFKRSPAITMEGKPAFEVNCEYVNAWVAWYSKDSFVQPHVHGSGDMFCIEYSLSTYLKVPKDYTELTFSPCVNNMVENFSIEVRKGDFLIFPSNLMHYTNDCEEGRVILSANFIVNITRLKNENGQEIKE
tara:strand:- start:202 stop:831 length:630 start_codon:yes stop_codon:yes gene_type:complete